MAGQKAQQGQVMDSQIMLPAWLAYHDVAETFLQEGVLTFPDGGKQKWDVPVDRKAAHNYHEA